MDTSSGFNTFPKTTKFGTEDDLAVFEEIGFLGFAIWVLWIIFIIYQAIKVGATALTVILVVLFLNLGESVLFSVGGMGLFQILIISGVITADNETRFHKEES